MLLNVAAYHFTHIDQPHALAAELREPQVFAAGLLLLTTWPPAL